MSQLITGEKTPQQMKDMRECGKNAATIYDRAEKIRNGWNERTGR